MKDPKEPKDPEPRLDRIHHYANGKVLSSNGWVSEPVQDFHIDILPDIRTIDFDDILGFRKGK